MTDRLTTVVDISKQAGALALKYFNDQQGLEVDMKGHQDFVSQADREVELLVRALLAQAFPDDAIVGEEHAPTPGTSGFTWVIDPIDGTANFINGIPAWTVVIAGVQSGQTQIGVIHDPCHEETFAAARGQGATLNQAPLNMPNDRTMSQGTIAVGYSGRVHNAGIVRLVTSLLDKGAMFYRNASGALSLAYVASGRFIGYIEAHMNAWDCLAGQLIVAEAGGKVEQQDADQMMRDGGRVIVGNALVFDALLDLAERSYTK
ncbi:MAG: inositol monophosphatase [Roseobacter sp.]